MNDEEPKAELRTSDPTFSVYSLSYGFTFVVSSSSQTSIQNFSHRSEDQKRFLTPPPEKHKRAHTQLEFYLNSIFHLNGTFLS